MEKICTRCNFRNPANRAVCQVCGHSKFSGKADVQVAVARQVPAVIDVVSYVDKLVEAVKQTYAKLQQSFAKNMMQSTAKPAEINTTKTVLQYRESPVFKDNEDLESMISWFKSYGVDRPLILETKRQPQEHGSKAA